MLLKFLLDPRVIIAAVVAGLLFFLYADLQKNKIQVATLTGEKTSLENEKNSLAAQLASALSIIDTLRKDVIRANKTMKELEFVRNEFNDLRKKYAEIQDKPYTCPELESRYEDYSIAIATRYNNFLRGKVNSMSTPSDSSSPTKAMPNDDAVGTSGN